MPSSEELIQRMDHNLSLHSPKTGEVGATLDFIRFAAKGFAREIIYRTPVTREQSLALTHIEEACQWAIAAVVRNQEAE